MSTSSRERRRRPPISRRTRTAACRCSRTTASSYGSRTPSSRTSRARRPLTKVLDAALAGREYLAGKLSIADFAIGPYIGVAMTCGLDLTPHTHLRAWTDRMTARESVRQTKVEAQAALRG